MMSKTPAKTPLYLAGWVALTAALNCAGWLLSGLRQLNAIGYAAIFLIMAVGLAWWWRGRRANDFQCLNLAREWRRFRRFFPAAFLVVALLAIFGGVLYPPNNYDALTYRLPRVLNWLAEGRWHWIPTYFNRLNTRAVAFEWLAAPVLLFTHTDRLLFLINIVSFLLLPGLFFSILTRLGVRSRVAWHWMWVLPTGYSYVLQSASLGNDLFGATLGLAAWDLALRARTSKSHADIWLSLLAAGLLTGSKTSNLPLLLPWLIAFWPSLRLVKDRIATSTVIALMSLVCSFLPMAAINYNYCGDWTGFVAEHCPFNQKTYLLHLEHNTLLQATQNLSPPIFPWAGAWNRAMDAIYTPAQKAELSANFEPSQAEVRMEEIQMEEWAGLGMGVTLLLLLSMGAAVIYSKGASAAPPPSGMSRLEQRALLLSPFFALGVFMAKASLASLARLETPYYAFVIPVLLVGGAQMRIVRTRWWRAAAGIVFLLTLVVLVITPARPLWPAQTILNRLHSTNPLMVRAARVYEIYSRRNDAFAPARELIPAEAKAIGYMAIDFPETSLWRPFGSRRVVQFMTTQSGAELRRRGVKYVLVNYNYAYYFAPTLEQWLAENNAEYVQKVALDLRAGDPPCDWRLIRLKD